MTSNLLQHLFHFCAAFFMAYEPPLPKDQPVCFDRMEPEKTLRRSMDSVTSRSQIKPCNPDGGDALEMPRGARMTLDPSRNPSRDERLAPR